jgi:hypothetical protein
VIAVLVAILFASSAFWVNWWWFGNMGQRGVLTARYTAEALSFLTGAILAAAVFGGNIVLALRRTRRDRPAGRIVMFADRLLLILAVAATAIVALAFGIPRGNGGNSGCFGCTAAASVCGIPFSIATSGFSSSPCRRCTRSSPLRSRSSSRRRSPSPSSTSCG